MDSLDKRRVEFTIVGLDEAIEKVTKLVELLKQVDEYKKVLTLLHSSDT